MRFGYQWWWIVVYEYGWGSNVVGVLWRCANVLRIIVVVDGGI